MANVGEMFGEIADPTVRIGTQRWYTVPLSILVHVVVVAGVVIVPVMAVDALPAPSSVMAFVVVPPYLPPPPPPPPPPSPPPPLQGSGALEKSRSEPNFDPNSVDGIEAGVVSGVAWGIVGGLLGAPSPPLPPPAGTTVRVGGNISRPIKVLDVIPVYPPDAEAVGVQGVVILQAIIGESGEVTQVTVLRSIPLLDEAAIRAVRLWVYRPTLLNGVPVAVVMTVIVNFTLQ